MESLALANAECTRLADRITTFRHCLQNVGTMTLNASSAHDAAIDGFRRGKDALVQRALKSRADLTAAELALQVRQFRVDWQCFASKVEELLASLEAAPLLESCP